MVRYQNFNEIGTLTVNDCLIDYVRETQLILKQMKIILPELNDPRQLLPWFGRDLYQGIMADIYQHSI